MYKEASELGDTVGDMIKTYLKEGINEIVESAFGVTGIDLDNPREDHALLLGGGVMLREIVDFLPSDDKFSDDVHEALDNPISKITHNRLYIPETAREIAFDVISPWIITPDAAVKVTFERVGTSGSESIIVPLEPTFMSAIPIPSRSQQVRIWICVVKS